VSQARPRIFIGLIEIAGYLNNLNRGFKSLGITSNFYDLYGHPFQYQSERVSRLASLHRYCSQRIAGKHFPTVFWRGLSFLTRAVLFAWALYQYDVFIYGFASTFFRYKELPVLRFFGKKIIFVFLGTDARPSYISGNILAQNVLKDGDQVDLDYLFGDTRDRKKRIDTIDRYADHVIDHPPTALFHTRKFISFMVVGFPFELQNTASPSPEEGRGSRPVRIVHAPSFPRMKGTDIIRGYIERFRQKGHIIEFIEIINRPHREVLNALAQCDFVIDQIYSDIPLGALGAEAAFFGKPTISGGYYSDQIRIDYPEEVIPPALYCRPNQIEDAIEKMIYDAQFRKDLGAAAKRFVESRWTLQEVAKRYLNIIEGTIPESWFFDPGSIVHIHGYGLHEDKLRSILHSFIERYGPEALQLHDKPDLQAAFISFVWPDRIK
jgi:glycosyltransferase involved in cell wall biosynthesis